MTSAHSTICAKSVWSVPSEFLVQCTSPTAATRTSSVTSRQDCRNRRAAPRARLVRPGQVPTMSTQHALTEEEKAFYCHTLDVFERAGVDVLVGGAYAFGRYTGIERHTKDFDIFVRAEDFMRTLEALAKAGYTTS